MMPFIGGPSHGLWVCAWEREDETLMRLDYDNGNIFRGSRPFTLEVASKYCAAIYKPPGSEQAAGFWRYEKLEEEEAKAQFVEWLLLHCPLGPGFKRGGPASARPEAEDDMDLVDCLEAQIEEQTVELNELRAQLIRVNRQLNAQADAKREPERKGSQAPSVSLRFTRESEFGRSPTYLYSEHTPGFVQDALHRVVRKNFSEMYGEFFKGAPTEDGAGWSARRGLLQALLGPGSSKLLNMSCFAENQDAQQALFERVLHEDASLEAAEEFCLERGYFTEAEYDAATG